MQCDGVSGIGQFSTLCVNFKSSIFVREVSMELAVTLLEDTVSVCGGGVGVGGDVQVCLENEGA